MDIKHILLATDLSDQSKQAHAHAVAVAQRLGARITLFHVNEARDVPHHGSAELSAFLEQVDARTAAALKQEAETLAQSGVTVNVAGASGNAAQEILGFIGAHTVDLLVLSRHGAR